MASFSIGAGAAALAVALSAMPAWAQWNNQPYSFRAGGGVGMSTAYRQAYIDQQISGNRPRNLLRGSDGSLLTVTEHHGQAFVSTPQPNYVINRGGIAAGISIGLGGVGILSPVDSWTGTVVSTLPAPGTGRPPIDTWVAQLDGLRPVD